MQGFSTRGWVIRGGEETRDRRLLGGGWGSVMISEVPRTKGGGRFYRESEDGRNRGGRLLRSRKIGTVEMIDGRVPAKLLSGVGRFPTSERGQREIRIGPCRGLVQGRTAVAHGNEHH
jgi:hypothetical protein